MKSHNSSDFQASAVNGLMPVSDVAALILSGASLMVAGVQSALDKLPAGNWIGGTTPYFMTDTGGRIVGDDVVFVTDLSAIGTVSTANYGEAELARISGDAPENGFALAILPAYSHCHERFALEAGGYPDTFLKPTVGWIAGYDLNDPKGAASVYDGRGPTRFDDRAVVAHVALRDDQMAMLDIVNIFEPGNGDVLTFEQSSFTPEYCMVDGIRRPFAAYLVEHGLADGAEPLIGDFAGAHINVSIKSADEGGHVALYAPVFPGIEYRFARPLGDYAGAFRTRLDGRADQDVIWSCNCILNFLFGGLEGKAIGGVAGPVTFGEIAYQLLNQTMVFVRRI